MGLLDIPRFAVGTSLKLAKLPFHVAARILSHSPADAERWRADAMRTAAAAQTEVAEEERGAEQRRAAAAEQRRAQAAERAAARRREAIEAKAKRDELEAAEAVKTARDERRTTALAGDEADRIEEDLMRVRGRQKGA